MIPTVILIYSFINRFFKQVVNRLTKKENILIIKYIQSKQKINYSSIESDNLFILEFSTQFNKGTEYVPIICLDNKILINNYFTKVFYSYSSKNMYNLKRLIKIKSQEIEREIYKNSLIKHTEELHKKI